MPGQKAECIPPFIVSCLYASHTEDSGQVIAGIGLDIGVCFSIQAEGTINTTAMKDFAIHSLLAATNAFPGQRSVVYY